MLALRGEDVDAGWIIEVLEGIQPIGAGGHVEIILLVDRHAVSAASLAEVVQFAAAGGPAVLVERKGVELADGDFGVIVVHEQRAVVGGNGDAIRPGDLVLAEHADEVLTVAIDAIDAFDIEFEPVAVGAVVGIGKVDAAAVVDAQIVGTVEAFSLELVAKDRALLGGKVDSSQAAAAQSAPLVAFASQETPLGVEHQAVGASAGAQEHVGRRGAGVQPHDAVVFDVAKEHRAAGVIGGTLGKHQLDGRGHRCGVGDFRRRLSRGQRGQATSEHDQKQHTRGRRSHDADSWRGLKRGRNCPRIIACRTRRLQCKAASNAKAGQSRRAISAACRRGLIAGDVAANVSRSDCRIAGAEAPGAAARGRRLSVLVGDGRRGLRRPPRCPTARLRRA